jgi:hypothetical protein
MKNTFRILLAVGLMAAIALAGVLVNLEQDPDANTDMPILSVACEIETGEIFGTRATKVGFHWPEKDDVLPVIWMNLEPDLTSPAGPLLSPAAGTIELLLSRPGSPTGIEITRYADYYFDLTALGVACPDGEAVAAYWTEGDDILKCEIPAADSSLYWVTVHYGESFVSYVFGTTRPEAYTRIGYVRIPEDGAKGALVFDPVEWITSEDTERISELGIEDDMPGGFYVYNPAVESVALTTEESTLYRILGPDGVNPMFVDWNGFASFVTSYQEDYGREPLCRIEEGKDGALVLVSEQYLP